MSRPAKRISLRGSQKIHTSPTRKSNHSASSSSTSQASSASSTILPRIKAPSLTMEWGEIEKDLREVEDPQISNGLQKLQQKSSTEALEADVTKVLLPLCMDHLQHHDIKVRAMAINIIANQIRAGNWAMEKLAAELANKLAKPNILDLKAGKSETKVHKKLHQDIIFVISDLHVRYPSKLMLGFKPVANYMIDCTNSHQQEVSTAACKFWGNLQEPPVPQKLLGEWMPPIFHKLNKLILALLRNMIYQEEYVRYMESLNSAAGNRPRTQSLQMQHLSDVRNYAALGFEKLCDIFNGEVTPIFKLCVQKWLHSDNWLEQEAMVLALGAYCQAMQGPVGLKEQLPDILTKLLEFLHSDKPLMRSITCFTMVHFMNVRVKGVKDPFGRMLRGSLNLLTDDNIEVQEQALRALGTFLAYGDRDFSAHSRKIVSAMKKVNDSTYGKARFTFYECIGHTFGRLNSMLDDNDVQTLMTPLIEHWRLLQWSQEVQATEEDLTTLCSCLCTVSMFAKGALATYNNILLERIAKYIPSLLETQPKNDLKSDLMTTHIVAYLDVISALYEGQGEGLNAQISQHKIVDMVRNVLKHSDKFRDEVVQSCLALLGHICRHNYKEIKPDLDEIISYLQTQMDSKSDSIRSNALWTLVHICRQVDEKNESLLALSMELTSFFLNVKAQESVVIHSATAFTYLAIQWPNNLTKVVFKDDVFTHLCAILQTPLSEDDDKVQIFSNLCQILTDNLQKVPKDSWIHFCMAAAMLDVPNENLREAIKNILKDVRTVAGNAVWNKINSTMGQQMAYNLRKRYKLY